MLFLNLLNTYRETNVVHLEYVVTISINFRGQFLIIH